MWWLAGTNGEIQRTLPGHHDCIHRKYRLTCAQFEDLLDRSSNRCEGCGTAAESTYFGRLIIDHASDLGWWAVRGLLCRYCNNTIRYVRYADRYASYYANAYFIRLLAAQGMHPVTPPEPPIGSVVVDHALRPYERGPQGWWPLHNWTVPNDFETWAGLIYAFGPHNVHVLDADHGSLAPTKDLEGN